MSPDRNCTIATHVDLERNLVAVEWIPSDAGEDWHGPLARAYIALEADDERYRCFGAEMPGDVEADALDAIGYARTLGRRTYDPDLSCWLEEHAS